MEFITVIFGSNKKPASLAIRAFTWSRFSHIGVIMPCGNVLEATFGEGVTLTPLDEFKSRYTKIEVANLPCECAEIAYHRGYEQVGKKYDIKAIVGIFIRSGKHDDSKWFCSELVAHMTGMVRLSRVNRVTPEMIYIFSRHIPDPSEIFRGIKQNGIRSVERYIQDSRR